MKEILILISGAIGGFLLHSVTMKVSFKQRTIENKIKVYDAIITHWVKMRNFVYAHHPGQPIANFPDEIIRQFDQIYGESQTFIAEAILVCEDAILTTDINALNEQIYRTEWERQSVEQVNAVMETFRVNAIAIIARMREDVKASTRLEWQDFSHILSGLRRKKS